MAHQAKTHAARSAGRPAGERRPFGLLLEWITPEETGDAASRRKTGEIRDSTAREHVIGRFHRVLAARNARLAREAGIPGWIAADRLEEVATVRAEAAHSRWHAAHWRSRGLKTPGESVFRDRFRRYLERKRERVLSAHGTTGWIPPRVVREIAERRGAAAAERFAGRRVKLMEEKYRKLSRIRTGVAIRGPASLDEVDRFAADLHAWAPWMHKASEFIWKDMRGHVRADGTGLRFRPILLDGPPGIGKSSYARQLALAAGVPVRFIDAGQASAAFRIAGVEYGWGTGCPGVPLEEIIQNRVGNPVMVVDEIDKASEGMWSNQGHFTSLLTALLGLLETETARNWECPYFRVRFDMSRVNWILVSNDTARLPGPLLDRCRVVRLSAPSVAEERAFVLRVAGEKLGRERGGLLAEAIARESGGRQLGLRRLRRMIEAAGAIDYRMVIH